MCGYTSVAIALLVHLTTQGFGAEQCICLPSRDANGRMGPDGKLAQGIQALIPAYQFNCTGTITRWTVFVVGAMPSRIDFQVWRPINASSEDTYQLLAANIYAMLMPEMGRISVSVPQDLQITVQPGDVLGMYAEHLMITTVPFNNVITFTVDNVPGPRDIFSTTAFETRLNNQRAPLIEVDVEVGSTETRATLAGCNTITTDGIMHIAHTSSVLTTSTAIANPGPSLELSERAIVTTSTAIANPGPSLELSERTIVTTSTVIANPRPSLELSERAIIGIVSGTVSTAVFMLALVLLVVICMRRKKGKRREAYGNRPNILRTLIHSDSFILLTSLRRVTGKLKNTGRYSSAHRQAMARTSRSDTSTTHELNTAIDGELAAGPSIPPELSRVSSIEMFDNPSYSMLMEASYDNDGNDPPEERVYDVVLVTAPLSRAEHESHIYDDADITYAEIQ